MSTTGTVGAVELILADIKYTYGDAYLSETQEDFWRAILSNFAADIVVRVLPDDPIAQQAVVQKAQAIGIDIGGADQAERSGGSVVGIFDHRRQQI
jgi:hypothetical protein